jgi:hypothetical protein
VSIDMLDIRWVGGPAVAYIQDRAGVHDWWPTISPWTPLKAMLPVSQGFGKGMRAM